MRVGGYSLDLYCDRYGVKPGEVSDHLGHRYDQFPVQFYGETGPECDRQARRKGWVIGRHRVLCPLCNPAWSRSSSPSAASAGTLPPDEPNHDGEG